MVYRPSLCFLGFFGILGAAAGDTIELPKLDYELDALEPYISAETLSYHYEKHHAGYVTNLNAIIAETPGLEGLSLHEIMVSSEGTTFNNAAQIFNHNFYWESMSPKGGGMPTGELYDAIIDQYGSFKDFVSEFESVASAHFGSGWAWLVKNGDGSVEVVGSHDALNPIVEHTGYPLLTCDVWEHAYYIDYRNGRASYLNSWWEVVNWDFAEERFGQHEGGQSRGGQDRGDGARGDGRRGDGGRGGGSRGDGGRGGGSRGDGERGDGGRGDGGRGDSGRGDGERGDGGRGDGGRGNGGRGNGGRGDSRREEGGRGDGGRGDGVRVDGGRGREDRHNK